jgi:ribosome maturation factor RimP
MSVTAQLNDLLEPLIDDLGYEFVGLEYWSNPRNRLLRVYIDAEPNGIGVEDCERVSREVSALLDVEDPISGEYTLEVSSPGVERPLFHGAQYQRFIGETAKLEMRSPIEGRRKFKGAIVAADENQVVLSVDGTEWTLALEDVVRARLAPDLGALWTADKD